MTSIRILGCRVDAIESDAAVERVVALANGAPGSIVVTLGVEMVMYARRDASFRALLARSALSVCDTIGILLASKLQRGPLRARVTGVALLERLVARSAHGNDLRLYFLGAAPGVAERAATALRERYPGAQIVDVHDGYFAGDQSEAVAGLVRASGANALAVGLGSPRQERWLDQFLSSTGCGVGIGVGGSFDVFAGNVTRAPRFLQRFGLEWLFRLWSQPARWRRQLVLPQFAVLALGEALGRLMGNSRNDV